MKKLLAALVIAIAPLTAAPSWSLDAPKGAIVLTVSGGITNANSGQEAVFDFDMLENLKGRSASMETPWTEGVTSFDGPLLRSILDAVGAKGRTLRLVALNDYAAEIPMEDATDLDTMLATRMNGKPMSVRDKGPLFLIYPFDEKPELYNEKYFSRSVWQIKNIEVVQ